MTRKFIQMGMTRAKRYANYQGGRKYADGKQKDKSEGHKGKEEKKEASAIFREYWETCKAHEGYGMLKEDFSKEQKEWDRIEKDRVKIEGQEEVKIEENEEVELPAKKRRKKS